MADLHRAIVILTTECESVLIRRTLLSTTISYDSFIVAQNKSEDEVMNVLQVAVLIPSCQSSKTSISIDIFNGSLENST